MTLDTWHLTHDMWHVTHGGGWTFSQNVSSPALTVLDRQYLEDILTNHDLLNQWTNEWMNYIGDCRKARLTGSVKNMIWGRRNKNWVIFKVVDLRAWGAPPHMGQDIDNSLSKLRPLPRNGSNKQFTKRFFPLQNSWSCPQAYRGGGCRLKLPINGAVDFLKKFDTTLQQSVLCQLQFLY